MGDDAACEGKRSAMHMREQEESEAQEKVCRMRRGYARREGGER